MSQPVEILTCATCGEPLQMAIRAKNKVLSQVLLGCSKCKEGEELHKALWLIIKEMGITVPGKRKNG